jgi:hypothetical protein
MSYHSGMRAFRYVKVGLVVFVVITIARAAYWLITGSW